MFFKGESEEGTVKDSEEHDAEHHKHWQRDDGKRRPGPGR
jgi:hypothetical protein